MAAKTKSKSKSKTTNYRKFVLGPGKYPVGKRGGQMVYEEFDESRLRKLVDIGNQFLGTGALIPVPFSHTDQSGTLVSPVNVAEQGVLMDALTGDPIGWDSSVNSGFVKRFHYGEFKDPDSGQTEVGLYCDMEIDGDSEVQDTPAYKIGRTVRQVSIGIHKNQEDSLGNAYDELPIHVAACINPRNSVQSNFVNASLFSDVLLFNTSSPPSMESDDSADQAPEKPQNPAIPKDPQTALGPDVVVANNVEGLRQVGLDLPEDTNEENFHERLTIAIRQYLASESRSKLEEDPDSLTKTPEGKAPSGAPIAMSNTNNPQPNEPTGKEAVLFANVLNSKRTSLAAKLDNLVKAGRANSEYVSKTLRPMVENINPSHVSIDQLSDDGDVVLPVEQIIMGLEMASSNDLTQPASGAGSIPHGNELSPPQPGGGHDAYQTFHEGPVPDDGVSDEELIQLSESIPIEM